MISEKDFTYCPNCGKQFSQKKEETLICDNCGLHYYISPRPSNAIILENKDGEILLVKRRVDPKKGFWDLPGGFIKPNETIENSLKREIKEELQVDLTDFTYFTSGYNWYEYKDLTFPTVCATFIGKIGEEKITPSDDAETYEFFKPTEIPLDKIAFNAVLTSLKRYLAKN